MKVTSRGRPDQLRECVKSYIKLSLDNYCVWSFTFDKDDYEKNRGVYDSLIDFTSGELNLIDRAGKIAAINSGVPKHEWDILLNISDDQIPIVEGYDRWISENMYDNLDASLWFHDGWQKSINTQEIIGRKYYDEIGYIYFPEYKSFFCDNESTEVAKRKGKLIQVDKCIIRHDHPAWNPKGNKYDQLYKENDKFWDHDKGLFYKRKRINFGL